ncbi:hypothetical protein BHE74_00037253 [Ensete ventricosum]|nr:hypothetical protein BHE74_00037253 [Ensete ventricosum]
MHSAAPSSSYCSRTLAATNSACSHEVAPQPQPTKLLPSSSSTVTAAFRLISLGCHLPTDISHPKNSSLDDLAASPEPQLTLLLLSSSSTVAVPLGCHPLSTQQPLGDFTTAGPTIL